MLADVHIKDWHRAHMKAVRRSIKPGSVSGPCSSHSSLLPHLCDQHTTHKCLPFSPATPTFLTWPRRGVTGVMVLTVRAGYSYYTHQKHSTISRHFLSNNSVGRSLLLYIPITSNLLSLLFSETIILRI
jgi:hypothetical protein